MSSDEKLRLWAKRRAARGKPPGPAPKPVCGPGTTSARDASLKDAYSSCIRFRGAGTFVLGSTVPVEKVALWSSAGKTPMEIVALFPRELTLAQCHAALAYYLMHREEVDREVARHRSLSEPGALSEQGSLPRLGLGDLVSTANLRKQVKED